MALCNFHSVTGPIAVTLRVINSLLDLAAIDTVLTLSVLVLRQLGHIRDGVFIIYSADWLRRCVGKLSSSRQQIRPATITISRAAFARSGVSEKS